MKLQLKLILFMGGIALCVAVLIVALALYNLNRTIKQIEQEGKDYASQILANETQDYIAKETQLFKRKIDFSKKLLSRFPEIRKLSQEKPESILNRYIGFLDGAEVFFTGTFTKTGDGYTLSGDSCSVRINDMKISKDVLKQEKNTIPFLFALKDAPFGNDARLLVADQAFWLLNTERDEKNPDSIRFTSIRLDDDFLKKALPPTAIYSYAVLYKNQPLMSTDETIRQAVISPELIPVLKDARESMTPKTGINYTKKPAFITAVPIPLFGENNTDVMLVKTSDFQEPVETITQNIDMKIERLFLYILSTSFIGLLIFFIPLIYFAKAISEPVGRAAAFADTLAGGEFPAQTSYNGGIEEIASLVKSLNHMRDRLSNMISKLKRSHERELQARKDAEAANHLKSDFLSNMSLELRNPLNSIMGFSSLIIKDLERGENLNRDDLASAMKTVHESAETLNELVGTLLELSRLDTADAIPNISIFETADLLRELCDSVSILVSEKGMILENHYSPDVPQEICTDREILFHVLELVLTCLIKTESDSCKISFGVSSMKNKVFFWFKTNGATSVVEDFNRYSISQTTLASSSQGTAILKLTIAKNHSHLIGADFEVSTDKDSDYSFRISFIRNDLIGAGLISESSSIHSATNYGELPGGHKTKPSKALHTKTRTNIMEAIKKAKSHSHQAMRILMAEDNEANRLLVEMMLKENNCTIESVRNGEECIRLLEMNDYNILLLDLHMPELDGYSVLKYIRSKKKYDVLSVIVLTAYLEEGDKEKLIAMGANRCILKPINMDELIEAVRSFSV